VPHPIFEASAPAPYLKKYNDTTSVMCENLSMSCAGEIDICELCDITVTAKLRSTPGNSRPIRFGLYGSTAGQSPENFLRARFMILKQRVDVDNASRKLAYRQQKTCLYARVAGVPVGFRGLKHP
jgi:hypothetical protein